MKAPHGASQGGARILWKKLSIAGHSTEHKCCRLQAWQSFHDAPILSVRSETEREVIICMTLSVFIFYRGG